MEVSKLSQRMCWKIIQRSSFRGMTIVVDSGLISLFLTILLCLKKIPILQEALHLKVSDIQDTPEHLCGLILFQNCLLYTSDAADEEDSVDLGGRRIIK